VLRALAALLMAVAGDAPRPPPREEQREPRSRAPLARDTAGDREWQEHAMEELRGPARREREPLPDAGAGALEASVGAGGEGSADEVEQLLADARARAHAVIDESIERAQELMRGASPEARAIERVERALGRLAGDVRSLHGRLDALEALLRGRDSAASAPPLPSAPPPLVAPAAPTAPLPAAAVATPLPPSPPPPVPPTAAPVSAPVAAAPAPASPPTPAPVPASQSTPAPPPAPAPAPAPPAAAPRPSAAPAGAPANGVAALSAPPRQLDAPPPVPAAPTPARAPVPPDVGAGAGADSGGALFSPGAPLTVRVSPVVGFQGLMRVQDAIARVRGVGEAGVEAYSQGEARLRLELVEPLAAAALAAALAERLAQPARVEEASTAERSVRLTLR
jgi:hypothetical protein